MNSSEKPTNRYEKTMLLSVQELPKKIITTSIIMLLSFLAVPIGPLYALIVKGEYHIPTGCIFPFTDPDTLEGYSINMFFQSIVAYFAMIGTISFELANTLAISTLHLMVKLTIIEMEDLSNDIETNKFHSKHVHCLNHICIRLQDIENYVCEYNLYAYWRNFFQPILTELGISIAFICFYLVTKIGCKK